MDTTVTVTASASVGPDTVAVRFATPDGFTAEPGQFVKISATVEGEGYARFYTLSSPDVDEEFEVTIEVDPSEGGPFSEYLAGLSAGDEVEISGPYGDDHYEGEARVVVLAGGPGIGPAVAIGERALADGNEAAVVYRDDAPAHGARLNDLQENGASVHVVGTDETEAFDEAVEEAVTGADDEQVFVFGFAPFVAAAGDAIEAAGGDPDAAKVENFG
ncbi:FAD-dependent oxidoreductase [Haloparvum sedimenti]|uniref:FAD-dependent oxidoreductase n=1 Tax=Haloparvum sedimenti TaxID=1678448 RepID=UPI00071E9158|nr:FAD-dependent oxidoreductase [Haloparvum sedimenti]